MPRRYCWVGYERGRSGHSGFSHRSERLDGPNSAESHLAEENAKGLNGRVIVSASDFAPMKAVSGNTRYQSAQEFLRRNIRSLEVHGERPDWLDKLIREA